MITSEYSNINLKENSIAQIYHITFNTYKEPSRKNFVMKYRGNFLAESAEGCKEDIYRRCAYHGLYPEIISVERIEYIHGICDDVIVSQFKRIKTKRDKDKKEREERKKWAMENGVGKLPLGNIEQDKKNGTIGKIYY